MERSPIWWQKFAQTSAGKARVFSTWADRAVGLFEKGGGAEEGGAVPGAL